MVEFPPNRVEAVVARMFDADKKVRTEAQHEIHLWQQTDGCEATALFLLQNTINVHTRHIAAEALQNRIKLQWMEMPDTFRGSCKEFLIHQLTVPGNAAKSQQILKMLSTIAIYEFPEVWTDFLTSLLTVNAENLRMHMGLLAAFETDLNDCDFVDLQRLRMLRRLFGSAAPQIIEIFTLSCGEIGVTNDALKCLNGVYLWGDAVNFVTPDLVNLLCQVAVGSGETRTTAFRVLRTILIDRFDFGIQFKVIGNVVIEMLSGFAKFTSDVMRFAIQFLGKYQHVFEAVICFPQDKRKAQVTQIFLGDDVETLEKGLVCQGFGEKVQKILHLTLSGSVPLSSSNEFWTLVASVIRSVSRGDCMAIYNPLVHDIKYGILNNITSVVHNNRFVSEEAIQALSMAMQMDPDFITGEPVNTNLCYAIAYSPPTEYVLHVLAQLGTAKGSQMGPAVFAMARFPSIQQEFFQMVLEMLESSATHLQVCAARALRARFDVSRETFPSYVIETIGQKAAAFYESLDEEAMILLFETCCLAGGAPFFVSVIASSLQTRPKKAFKVLREIFRVSKDSIFEEFWGASCVILSECQDLSLIELVTSAVTAAIVRSDFAVIERHVDEYVHVMCERREALHLLFSSIAICRARHQEMDQYCPAMQTVITSLTETPKELFAMLAEFSPQCIEMELLCSVLGAGIRNPRAVEAACECAVKIMERIGAIPDVFIQNVIPVAIDEILSVPFPALFSFLRSVMVIDREGKVYALLIEILVTACQGTKREFIEGFVGQMERVKESSYGFCAAMSEFLVSVKAAIPIDFTGIMFSESKAALIECGL